MDTTTFLQRFAAKLTPGTGEGQVNIPTAAADSAQLLNILNAVYLWAGIIAVLVLTIAGFMYVTSSGDASRTKHAKDAILYTVIGLVVIMLAFTITQFVLGRF